MVTTEEREKEAGQEIQEIFNKAKSRSAVQIASVDPVVIAVPNQYPKSSSTGPVLNMVPQLHRRKPSEASYGSSLSDDEGNHGNDGEICHNGGGHPDAAADRMYAPLSNPHFHLKKKTIRC
jgi:hypothetical protein